MRKEKGERRKEKGERPCGINAQIFLLFLFLSFVEDGAPYGYLGKEKELAQWSHGSFSFLLYYGPCSPQGYFSFLLSPFSFIQISQVS